MSDFLTRLVERTQGTVQVAQPVIPPMFASVSTTLSDYSQNSLRDSEPMNVPNILNRAMVTPPANELSSATLNQSFQRTSGKRFAPLRQVETDLSEQVESSFPQAEQGIIEHSSNLRCPENLTDSKPQKENFSGNNDSSTHKIVTEYAQKTRIVAEKTLDAKRDDSGKLVEPDRLDAQLNLPDAERTQNTGAQFKPLGTDKRNVSPGVIKNKSISAPQELAEIEPVQNIGLRPENSLKEKRVASKEQIEPHEAGALHKIIEVKPVQKSLQSEHSLNEKQDAPGEPIYFNRASALRKKPESIEVKSAKTPYPKPHSPGDIRFQQDSRTEPSPVESTIKVTIGRVEVRAIMPAMPSPPAKRAKSQGPILSLDDYLKQRNEGKR